MIIEQYCPPVQEEKCDEPARDEPVILYQQSRFTLHEVSDDWKMREWGFDMPVCIITSHKFMEWIGLKNEELVLTPASRQTATYASS
jgi:hypothetical protein